MLVLWSGALAADMPVVFGLARHEVDRDAANLGTVQHQLHVLRLGVPPSRLQAVIHRHVKAGDVAFVAGVDARLHLGIDLMHCLSFHMRPAPLIDTRYLALSLAAVWTSPSLRLGPSSKVNPFLAHNGE